MSCKDLSKFKILVAEDSRPVRLVLKTYLAQLGIKPVFAVNGSEALEQLNNEEFDMALMDVHMPEMNGTEVVSRIRNEGITTPVFAMTTGDNADLLTECLDCGYNSFLLKPIVKTELAKIISRFTD
ncbi:response regulator [Maridesulfovibrio ferrireducens]|uniref:Response regulator receiver domain-containing protein n=1 Tax=Maridesulfovibrio ferrireducens TaxID=246191 RepID=A0A1G9FZ39_9BACT|nr:response regulator [Maridesulfovibrio ferrireducens]MBI9109862.1 response regulator [Maridesulfovibrio ferrireducens]SDK93585.1 Response regulator receiver domain-containing protein [Maridesulfovibrio ferrireducens]